MGTLSGVSICVLPQVACVLYESRDHVCRAQQF